MVLKRVFLAGCLRFYAISVERRVTHPVVSTLLEAARESLFADESQQL
jgi:hypothetical protein